MSRLRPSLTLNAVSLMTATLVTNALGLVFWAAASHLRPPAIVGRASATIAAMILLATVGQLNLTNVFIRLLPQAGGKGPRLVKGGYAAAGCLVLIVAACYAFSGLGRGLIGGGWESRTLFVIAVLVLTFFALQDAVLIALRLTPWVMVENVSFATAKLALLFLLSPLPLRATIVVAWVAPAAVAVVVVSGFLARRVFPPLAAADGLLPPRGQVLSFVAGEYTGSICATITMQAIPLLVVWRLGPAQAAYLALPWLIATGISLLLWNVASVFVVEAVVAPKHSGALICRTLILGAVVVAGALIACLLVPAQLLRLAGYRYAINGAELLRLVGLSVPFVAVVTLYSTLIWLDRRVWALAAIQAAFGILLLGGSLALMPRLGLNAVGWANLATQACAAALMAPLVVRRLRHASVVQPS